MTPQPRPTRLAPLLIVAGCLVAVLFGAYVGGYFWLGRRLGFGNGDGGVVEFGSMPSFRMYWPAVLVEAKLRGHPIVVSYPVDSATDEYTVVQ